MKFQQWELTFDASEHRHYRVRKSRADRIYRSWEAAKEREQELKKRIENLSKDVEGDESDKELRKCEVRALKALAQELQRWIRHLRKRYNVTIEEPEPRVRVFSQQLLPGISLVWEGTVE